LVARCDGFGTMRFPFWPIIILPAAVKTLGSYSYCSGLNIGKDCGCM